METEALTLCYEVAKDVQLGKVFISQLALNQMGLNHFVYLHHFRKTTFLKGDES